MDNHGRPRAWSVTLGNVTTSLDLSRPFRRSTGLRAGLSDRMLAGPAYRRLFRDVYISSAVVVTHLIRAEAALLVSPPGSYLSHHSAAMVWGGVVPSTPDVHVATPGTPTRRAGIMAHRARPGMPTTSLRELALTTPVAAYLDLAGWLTLVDLVVLGDSLVRAGRCTPGQLIEASASYRGRGARLARRAAGLVRDGVDSPMESRLRMLLVLAGLPEPVVNHQVWDEAGRLVMRFDLSYPGLRLVIEYDGRQHADSPAQWEHDLWRREQLDRLGWRIVVVTAAGLFREPDRTLARVVAALGDRGRVIDRLRPEWEDHFPVRHGSATRAG